jgi:hypothetical protein
MGIQISREQCRHACSKRKKGKAHNDAAVDKIVVFCLPLLLSKLLLPVHLQVALVVVVTKTARFWKLHPGDLDKEARIIRISQVYRSQDLSVQSHLPGVAMLIALPFVVSCGFICAPFLCKRVLKM